MRRFCSPVSHQTLYSYDHQLPRTFCSTVPQPCIVFRRPNAFRNWSPGLRPTPRSRPEGRHPASLRSEPAGMCGCCPGRTAPGCTTGRACHFLKKKRCSYMGDRSLWECCADPCREEPHAPVYCPIAHAATFICTKIGKTVYPYTIVCCLSVVYSENSSPSSHHASRARSRRLSCSKLYSPGSRQAKQTAHPPRARAGGSKQHASISTRHGIQR